MVLLFPEPKAGVKVRQQLPHGRSFEYPKRGIGFVRGQSLNNHIGTRKVLWMSSTSKVKLVPIIIRKCTRSTAPKGQKICKDIIHSASSSSIPYLSRLHSPSTPYSYSYSLFHLVPSGIRVVHHNPYSLPFSAHTNQLGTLHPKITPTPLLLPIGTSCVSFKLAFKILS